MSYCVYILYSSKLNRYYIGMTENLELRLQFHNAPIESRKFTSKGIPWTLQASIPCDSKSQALRLEQFVKRMKSRVFIEKLISDTRLQHDLKNKFAPD